MREASVRRLPVVDDDELVGIVTTTDLAYYLPRLRTAIRRER
jgi:CBS domain-containing protein